MNTSLKPIANTGEIGQSAGMTAPSNVIPLALPAHPVTPAHTRSHAKTASSAHQGEHRFKYQGRTWRIFKRSTNPDAYWQIVLRRENTREPHTLRTSSINCAIAEAKPIIDRWLDGWRRPARVQDSPCATIGDLCAVAPQLAIRASAKGRQQYAWAMRWVLRRAVGLATDAEVDALPATILNADTGRAFFKSVLEDCQKMTSQAEQNTAKRTALQIYGFAKALISPVAVESMRKDCQLTVPDVNDFRLASKTGFNLLKPGDASEFHAPDDAILRRSFREWLRLGRRPGYVIPAAGPSAKGYEGEPLPEWLRRNIFIAAGLMLSCGLRKSEVTKVRWNWWKSFNHGVPHLSELNVDVKSGSNEIHVVPVDPFWTLLNRLVDRNGWRGEPGDLCLAERPKVAGVHRSLKFAHGGKSDRLYWPFYHIGKGLRVLGWQTQKSNHALRDYAASMVTMRYGLEAACDFCRHGQLATTQAHYNNFRTLSGQVDPRRLAWFRWAK